MIKDFAKVNELGDNADAISILLDDETLFNEALAKYENWRYTILHNSNIGGDGCNHIYYKFNTGGLTVNQVNIIGTLVRDVEVKYLPSGTALGSFSIAVNQDYKKQDGTKVEKVSFFDIKVIGKQSEIINQFFHKGSRIGITGELEQESWQSATGENKSRVIIKLNGFSFIDRKQQEQQPQPQQKAPEIDIDEDEIPF